MRFALYISSAILLLTACEKEEASDYSFTYIGHASRTTPYADTIRYPNYYWIDTVVVEGNSNGEILITPSSSGNTYSATVKNAGYFWKEGNSMEYITGRFTADSFYFEKGCGPPCTRRFAGKKQ